MTEFETIEGIYVNHTNGAVGIQGEDFEEDKDDVVWIPRKNIDDEPILIDYEKGDVIELEVFSWFVKQEDLDWLVL